MKRGDVVLMVMPGDFGKPRPGVVVQADTLGVDVTTVIVCPLSSDLRQPALLRPALAPDARNNLPVPSQIMTDKLAAIRRDKIRQVVGELDPAAVEQLDRALMVVLGLAR